MNFIYSNFIYIILLLGFLIMIFSSKTYKKKKAILLFCLLFFTFVSMFVDYYSINSNVEIKKTLSIISLILKSIEMTLLLITINDNSIKYGILLVIPSSVFLTFSLLTFNNSLLFEINNGLLITGNYIWIFHLIVMINFILSIIIGIILYTNEKHPESYIIFAVSVFVLLSLILDSLGKGVLVSNTVIILGIIMIFILDYSKEINLMSKKKEELLQEQKTSLMISQIQPHFMYNTLATIGYLCKVNPNAASQAIDEFCDYLRANLNSISQKTNVPFMIELKHVQTYLKLEKLRFEEKLQIFYDIEFTDFLIPSLSIQPIVENAVKHGICEKVGGGTIYIRTIPYDDRIKIVIEDDGVGFDEEALKHDGKTHVGLENVKSRLETMANGTIELRSQKNKGTIVTITIPRR